LKSIYIEFYSLIISNYYCSYSKSEFDTFSNIHTDNLKQDTNLKSILLTIIVTSISSMIAYFSMYFIFGYGGGMLVTN